MYTYSILFHIAYYNDVLRIFDDYRQPLLKDSFTDRRQEVFAITISIDRIPSTISTEKLS